MDKDIRDIRIDLIMDNPNPIVNWFNDLWDSLTPVKKNIIYDDHSEISYVNGYGEWVFYKDLKYGKFWCHKDRYWVLLFTKYKLNYYSDIQEITKILLENKLRCEITEPRVYDTSFNPAIEDKLNIELADPKFSFTLAKKLGN